MAGVRLDQAQSLPRLRHDHAVTVLPEAYRAGEHTALLVQALRRLVCEIDAQRRDRLSGDPAHKSQHAGEIELRKLAVAEIGRTVPAQHDRFGVDPHVHRRNGDHQPLIALLGEHGLAQGRTGHGDIAENAVMPWPDVLGNMHAEIRILGQHGGAIEQFSRLQLADARIAVVEIHVQAPLQFGRIDLPQAQIVEQGQQIADRGAGREGRRVVDSGLGACCHTDCRAGSSGK